MRYKKGTVITFDRSRQIKIMLQKSKCLKCTAALTYAESRANTEAMGFSKDDFIAFAIEAFLTQDLSDGNSSCIDLYLFGIDFGLISKPG